MTSTEPHEQPTPRQVLYALVAGGFFLVVLVLAGAAAAAGLVPTWWSVSVGVVWLLAVLMSVARWRKTGTVLGLSIGLFIVWTVGTLVVR